MSEATDHLFWDSCVFYAYLSNLHTIYDISSIDQYLQETKEGKHRIYTSSVALVEVVPSAIKRPEIGSFEEFITTFQGAITIIDPTPNIMFAAARLKDLPYRKGTSTNRRLSTGDAIMLASCVHLRDDYGVNVHAFHTFDDGKKRHPIEGKTIPLISYQEWCEGLQGDHAALAKKVVDLSRCRPIHPRPTLFPPTAQPDPLAPVPTGNTLQ